MVRRDNRGREREDRRTTDKSGDHLMKEREREEKRASSARERERERERERLCGVAR